MSVELETKTGLKESLYCFKCGQSKESKLHTEQRLGAHTFEPSVSLDSHNAAMKELTPREKNLPAWNAGFDAAKNEFLVLLAEQQESVAKWLFKISSHAIRDKITFEQAPEVTQLYWREQAKELLVLLEEGLK